MLGSFWGLWNFGGSLCALWNLGAGSERCEIWRVVLSLVKFLGVVLSLVTFCGVVLSLVKFWEVVLSLEKFLVVAFWAFWTFFWASLGPFGCLRYCPSFNLGSFEFLSEKTINKHDKFTHYLFILFRCRLFLPAFANSVNVWKDKHWFRLSVVIAARVHLVLLGGQVLMWNLSIG